MQTLVPNTQTGSLTDHQHGTNDTLIGVDNVFNTLLLGDAFNMFDKSRGGNDTLFGGAETGDANVFNFLYGEAEDMYDNSHGGNDMLIGGADAFNRLSGDAENMHDLSLIHI